MGRHPAGPSGPRMRGQLFTQCEDPAPQPALTSEARRLPLWRAQVSWFSNPHGARSLAQTWWGLE